MDTPPIQNGHPYCPKWTPLHGELVTVTDVTRDNFAAPLAAPPKTQNAKNALGSFGRWCDDRAAFIQHEKK